MTCLPIKADCAGRTSGGMTENGIYGFKMEVLRRKKKIKISS